MVVDLVTFTPNRLSSSLISLLLASVAMSQTVELKVRMSCGGCSGAVKRVLSKMEGVESFDIDMEKQKVTVKGNVQPDAVFQTVSKTGKATEYWVEEAPGAADSKAAEVEAKAPVDTKTAEVEAKAPAEAAAVI